MIERRFVRETHQGRVVRAHTPRPKSVSALLTEAVARAPGREAVIDGSLRLDYSTLDTIVRKTAASLRALGLTQSDRVALLLANRAEYRAPRIIAANSNFREKYPIFSTPVFRGMHFGPRLGPVDPRRFRAPERFGVRKRPAVLLRMELGIDIGTGGPFGGHRMEGHRIFLSPLRRVKGAYNFTKMQYVGKLIEHRSDLAKSERSPIGDTRSILRR